MSTVQHIEVILKSGRKMPTYRVNLNPATYRWQIVCGVDDNLIDDRECDIRSEAIIAMMKLKGE